MLVGVPLLSWSFGNTYLLFQDEEEIYTTIQQLRDQSQQLNRQIVELESNPTGINNFTLLQGKRSQLSLVEEQIRSKNEERYVEKNILVYEHFF